jgi:hypothetical protein
MSEERLDFILDGIWDELMTMNALTALKFQHDPCLSSEERGFVAGVASSVIEAEADAPFPHGGEDEEGEVGGC